MEVNLWRGYGKIIGMNYLEWVVDFEIIICFVFYRGRLWFYNVC